MAAHQQSRGINANIVQSPSREVRPSSRERHIRICRLCAAGYKPNRHNTAALAREEHIATRVAILQEEQLAMHQQATVEAAAAAKVTLES